LQADTTRLKHQHGGCLQQHTAGLQMDAAAVAAAAAGTAGGPRRGCRLTAAGAHRQLTDSSDNQLLRSMTARAGIGGGYVPLLQPAQLSDAAHQAWVALVCCQFHLAPGCSAEGGGHEHCPMFNWCFADISSAIS
jgi:hypothetical protein